MVEWNGDGTGLVVVERRQDEWTGGARRMLERDISTGCIPMRGLESTLSRARFSSARDPRHPRRAAPRCGARDGEDAVAGVASGTCHSHQPVGIR